MAASESHAERAERVNREAMEAAEKLARAVNFGADQLGAALRDQFSKVSEETPGADPGFLQPRKPGFDDASGL